MIMWDLCCGLKGASRAMKERGWEVFTLDNDPAFNPDILTDVREFHFYGRPPDLIWASPPCNEFSRESMPWAKTGKAPDLSIYEACKRIIAEAMPRYYIIENTRGAVPYFGKPSAVHFPYYLWGFFPSLGDIEFKNRRRKQSLSGKDKALRALIPYCLSLRVALVTESQKELTNI